MDNHSHIEKAKALATDNYTDHDEYCDTCTFILFWNINSDLPWIRSDSWVTVHLLKDLVKQADTDGPHCHFVSGHCQPNDK